MTQRRCRLNAIGPASWWVTRLGAVALAATFVTPAAIADEPPIQLKIVGGLANVGQYNKFEAPFWLNEVPRITGDRVHAEIQPFDRSGLAGQEMLQLMRLGIVPFGTALLALVSGDEPELNAVDLPTLNPNIASLRRTVEIYRPHLHETLQNQYNIELLGIYAYPAQVLFCTKKFSSLKGLAGRRVRTSSVGQSEMMTSLGAVPVQIPFSGIVNAVEHNVVDCVITGTMSGSEIGLPAVTSFISPMAISWGLSFFGANSALWNQLPADIRMKIKDGIGNLEQAIWADADRETANGIASATGSADCVGPKSFHMALVPITADDELERKSLLTRSILPKWIQRCGMECVAAWNSTLGNALKIPVSPDLTGGR